MQVIKKDLEKSQIELTIELSLEEFAPYIEKGAKKVSEEVKIEGFRPGKVPYDVLKQKIGEMTILEEAAHLAINKTIDETIDNNIIGSQVVGQPQVNITKLAPNNPLEYKVIVSILPPITLGDYKNLKLKEEKAKIDEKELEKSLNDLREMRATEAIIDREIKDGDKVILDINMSLDNVPVENGQHKDLAVLIGKDYFVPGFDRKLIGAKKGEEKKFILPYPEDHHQANLAGKLVEFVVKVKEVYERIIPELNDEFASFFRLKDLAELKKNLQESLLHEKKHNLDLKNESEMISKIVEHTKFGELPEEIITSEAKNMLAELEQSVIRQGGKFEDYLKHLNKTIEDLKKEFHGDAEKKAKLGLILNKIAEAEKIIPDPEQVANEVAMILEHYKEADPERARIHAENVLTNEKDFEFLESQK